LWVLCQELRRRPRQNRRHHPLWRGDAHIARELHVATQDFATQGVHLALDPFGTRLAGSALEGMARQPEATGSLRATMLIAAALVEGVALFAQVICIILVFR
jgi:ATP synthase F0 subunit c